MHRPHTWKACLSPSHLPNPGGSCPSSAPGRPSSFWIVPSLGKLLGTVVTILSAWAHGLLWKASLSGCHLPHALSLSAGAPSSEVDRTQPGPVVAKWGGVSLCPGPGLSSPVSPPSRDVPAAARG